MDGWDVEYLIVLPSSQRKGLVESFVSGKQSQKPTFQSFDAMNMRNGLALFEVMPSGIYTCIPMQENAPREESCLM